MNIKLRLLIICLCIVTMVSYCEDRGSKAKAWLSDYEPKHGDELVIYFTVPASFPQDGWIGILPSETEHGFGSWDMTSAIFREPIAGRTMDSLNIVIPDSMLGDWDVRMYKSSQNGTEVFSIPFRVQGSYE